MNEIGYIREKVGLTQEEAAKLLGISRRSYQQYETEHQKVYTYKYKYFLEVLSKQTTIDEEHGVLNFDDIVNTCKKVFKDYEVNFCYLFGSYAKNKAKGSSDVDLLIDAASIKGAKFYGLVETLRTALSKKVDLLDINQLVNNKELLSEILKEGIKIYG